MNNYEELAHRITEFLKDSEVYVKEEYLLPWSNDADEITSELQEYFTNNSL